MADSLEGRIRDGGGAVLVQLRVSLAVDLVGVGVLLVRGASRGVILGLGLLNPLGLVVDVSLARQGEGGGLVGGLQALVPLDGAVELRYLITSSLA